MAANRRVNPARKSCDLGANDLLVERLAHPVQALKFEIALRSGELQNRRDGVRIMSGELRIERVARPPDRARACEIGHIGRHLARIDGKKVQTALLRTFYLCVPISAFDETQHET